MSPAEHIDEKGASHRDFIRSLPAEVEVGGVPKELLLRSLAASGVQVNPIGIQLFQDSRFTVRQVRERLAIACLKVAELGFSEGATYSQVVRAAEQRQLTECPLELGPHLRLAFLDQVEGSEGHAAVSNTAPPGAITVASPPLDNEESTPKGFYLRRIDGALWLRGYRSWEGHVWRPDDAFVFCKFADAA